MDKQYLYLITCKGEYAKMKDWKQVVEDKTGESMLGITGGYRVETVEPMNLELVKEEAEQFEITIVDIHQYEYIDSMEEMESRELSDEEFETIHQYLNKEESIRNVEIYDYIILVIGILLLGYGAYLSIHKGEIDLILYLGICFIAGFFMICYRIKTRKEYVLEKLGKKSDWMVYEGDAVDKHIGYRQVEMHYEKGAVTIAEFGQGNKILKETIEADHQLNDRIRIFTNKNNEYATIIL